MKSLLQYITEQSRQRNKIIDRADYLAEPIFLHMIKAQMPSQIQDRQKHLTDIARWIRSIDKMKSKSSKPKMSELLLGIWTEHKTYKLDDILVQDAKYELGKNYIEHVHEINVQMLRNIENVIKKIDKHDVSTVQSILHLLEQEL